MATSTTRKPRAKQSQQAQPTVRKLIDSARAGKVSRRKLLTGLAALGLTGAGATAVLAVTHHTAPNQRIHLQLHDQHVVRQTQGDVGGMMSDYAHNAVVDDPLFDKAFIGLDAIAARYASEVASVPDRVLRIVSRSVTGNTVIVEWEAAGTHMASFLGFGGTGRRYQINGVTVVTRRNGLIVRESHFYDVGDLRRQIVG